MTDGRGDPRWRPFRVGALSIYLVFSVGFSLLVIYSVFKSVLEMTPASVRSGPEIFTLPQCVKGAQAMLDELEAQRRGFTLGSAARADDRFLEFRIDWLVRKGRLESGCGLDRPERVELKRVFGALDTLVDLYTTESVQFAGSIGAEVDRIHEQFERLESAQSKAQSADGQQH